MRNYLLGLLFATVFMARGCGCGNLPNQSSAEFPLPPPQPSATDNIPLSFFASCKQLGDLNNKLSLALDENGYQRKSYFHVPNGFALVTQLEQINEDGTARPESERWQANRNGPQQFSLRQYIEDLLFAKPGFYRTIVFIVTDKVFSYSNERLTKTQAMDWLNAGTNRLPPATASLPFTGQYSLDVLIYEFRKKENGDSVNIVLPSPIPGPKHIAPIKSLITK